MMMTWHCFEAFLNEAVGTEWSDALLEQARQERPDLLLAGNSPENFIAFARDFGGLMSREAFQMYNKHFYRWCGRI